MEKQRLRKIIRNEIKSALKEQMPVKRYFQAVDEIHDKISTLEADIQTDSALHALKKDKSYARLVRNVQVHLLESREATEKLASKLKKEKGDKR